MRLLKMIGAILIGIFALAFLAGIAQRTSPPAAPPPSAQQNEQYLRASVGAARLHDATRDPDSFKLASVLVMADQSVCYEYRSRNGYGGINTELALQLPDSSILTNRSSGFHRAWQSHCARQIGDDLTGITQIALDNRRRP